MNSMPTGTPYIESVTIRGFKSIASIENLKLRPINILIGANGSGKSNFIEVFSFLLENKEDRLEQYVERTGGAEKILHFGSKVTREAEFSLHFRGDEKPAGLKFIPVADDQLTIALFNETDVKLLVGSDDWRVYHLHDTSTSSRMRKTAGLHDNDYLRPDGANLSSFLYLLQEMPKYRGSYNLIRNTVKFVAPFFEDFSLKPVNLKPDSIRLQWRHKGSDQYFDASSLSDGTLRFIALATLFLQPKELRPSLILVDEPELGLHPYAIQLLASLIKQAAVESQVIVSTQSPILLDHFEPEDTLVADRVGHATQIRRLDSAPLAKWLEDYSLGQLWEKNEFGGLPSPE